MTITITLTMIISVFSLLAGWTAFLLGAIKWLLNRQLIGLEAKIEAAEKKAAEATTEISKHKESISTDLNQHKEALTIAVTTLRLEFSQKATCSNHQRMEENDVRLFKSLTRLEGDMRELIGAVNGIKKQTDLMYQHHLGEK
jgi:hypothetical protein